MDGGKTICDTMPTIKSKNTTHEKQTIRKLIYLVLHQWTDLRHEDLSEWLKVFPELLLCRLPGQPQDNQVGALVLLRPPASARAMSLPTTTGLFKPPLIIVLN